MDEQIKLAHKLVDLVDGGNKDLCDIAAVQCGQARVPMLKSVHSQGKKEDEKFNQFVYLSYKL